MPFFYVFHFWFFNLHINSFLFQAKENFTLQSSLENQKKFLHERRITLEQEVNSSWAISPAALSFIFFILHNVIDASKSMELKMGTLVILSKYSTFRFCFLVCNNAIYLPYVIFSVVCANDDPIVQKASCWFGCLLGYSSSYDSNLSKIIIFLAFVSTDYH